jgi:hypothetical protein
LWIVVRAILVSTLAVVLLFAEAEDLVCMPS